LWVFFKVNKHVSGAARLAGQRHSRVMYVTVPCSINDKQSNSWRIASNGSRIAVWSTLKLSCEHCMSKIMQKRLNVFKFSAVDLWENGRKWPHYYSSEIVSRTKKRHNGGLQNRRALQKCIENKKLGYR